MYYIVQDISCTVQYSKSCNYVQNDGFVIHYDQYCDQDDDRNHTITGTTITICTTISNTILFSTTTTDDGSTIEEEVCTTVDDFVCDNTWYYINNNDCDPVGNQDNSNSIQAIVPTILEVRMNGIFYILAKKKYILYLLIPRKRSSHTIQYSEHQNIPYIVQNIPYII